MDHIFVAETSEQLAEIEATWHLRASITARRTGLLQPANPLFPLLLCVLLRLLLMLCLHRRRPALVPSLLWHKNARREDSDRHRHQHLPHGWIRNLLQPAARPALALRPTRRGTLGSCCAL